VLNQQGFERLTGREFRNRRVDRESCWRREFNFTEVAQRIPIDRQRASEGYPSVTDELLDDLSDGGAAVLTGDPGAGKTTTTRMVAHRWHTREGTGPVLYRQHRNESVTHPDTLVTAIEEVLDDSPILVVVEDLPRHQTLPFVEVLHALEPDDNISLLLNSRTREWDSLDERARRHDGIDTSSKRGTEVVETPSRYPERREMPALHSNEIRRLKERFERETGRTVHADAEELATIIFETEAEGESTMATAGSQTGLEAGQSESQPTTNAGHGVSPLLLLMYHFPVGGVDVEAGERETALHENVSRIYRRINGPEFDEELRSVDADEELLDRVALLANVMNAAEVPLHRRLFDALADTEEETDTIENVLNELDGLLFFGIEDEEYLFHHPIWSQLYLKELIEKEESSRKQFETVVNALFRFAAANQVRTGQQSVVDRLVSSVFALCEEYPLLEPLFVTTSESDIEVPDACSLAVQANCALYRHRMYRTLGEGGNTHEELRIFKNRADRDSKNVISRALDRLPGSIFTQQTQADSVYYTHRGNVAHEQDDYETAKQYYEQSLTIERDRGDRAGEAKSLNNLGNVAHEQDDYETAQNRYREASDGFLELGAVRRAITALSHLSIAAAERDDTETALNACETALSLIKEADLPGLDERAREFQSRAARLEDT
jgi:tetratricopeptide (TPR) repeat protein